SVKRVGCVGMCHRTPLVEFAQPGKPAAFYSDLSPTQARNLVLRHFRPRRFSQKLSRLWTRTLDALLLDNTEAETSPEPMELRAPAVNAFLEKQVHIATEGFGKLDPL